MSDSQTPNDYDVKLMLAGFRLALVKDKLNTINNDYTPDNVQQDDFHTIRQIINNCRYISQLMRDALSVVRAANNPTIQTTNDTSSEASEDEDDYDDDDEDDYDDDDDYTPDYPDDRSTTHLWDKYF